MTTQERELLALAIRNGGKVGKSMAENMADQPLAAKLSNDRPGGRVKHVQGRMNKREASHALYLADLQRQGKVIWWTFESIKLRLADRTWYTADFYVEMPAPNMNEFHEVKGFMEDDAAVKIKVAARLFPWFVFRLFTKKGMKVIPNR